MRSATGSASLALSASRQSLNRPDALKSSAKAVNGSRSCSGPRSPSWLRASGSDSPARIPDAKWSTASGHRSRIEACFLAAREATRANGPREAIPAKANPITGDPDAPVAKRVTTRPTAKDAPTRAHGVTPGAPARMSWSCVRSCHPLGDLPADSCWGQNDIHTKKRPAPIASPRTALTPASPAGRRAGNPLVQNALLRGETRLPSPALPPPCERGRSPR